MSYYNAAKLCPLIGHKWGKWYMRSRKVVAEQRGGDCLPYWMMINYRERACSRCHATEEGKI